MTRRRVVTVALVAIVQLLVVGLAVAPRLSAHVRGEEYRLAVAPVDPVDPFRGAYVALGYPGLTPPQDGGRWEPPADGEVFVPLVRDGDLWRAERWVDERPDDAPYLACHSDGWGIDCGIGSWFADQQEARRLEQDLADGAVATVRVDDRGRAVIVGLDAG